MKPDTNETGGFCQTSTWLGDTWTPHIYIHTFILIHTHPPTHTHPSLKDRGWCWGWALHKWHCHPQRAEHCVERHGEWSRVTFLGRNSAIWPYDYCELNILYLHGETQLLLESDFSLTWFEEACSREDAVVKTLQLSSIREEPFDRSLKGN